MLTHRASIYALMLSLLALAASGCSDGPSKANADEPAYESEEERKYAQFADRFASLIVAGKYDDARAMGSSHFKDAMTSQDVADFERKARAFYGDPVTARKAYGATTDADDLAGPNHYVDGEDATERAFRKMAAERYTGDLPDSVPASIRRASVSIEVVRDPRTVPDFESPVDPSEMTEDDLPVSFLTVVLVEENGKLGVAHYWYRWPDMWD